MEVNPTDPDTLKLVNKIIAGYNKEKAKAQEPEALQEAMEAVRKNIENRAKNPERTFVSTHDIKRVYSDKKVERLAEQISTGSESAPSLHHHKFTQGAPQKEE